MKIGRMFMFGYRSDGRKIKNIPPFFKIIPQVMRTRSDSQVYYTYDMPIKEIDNYIDKKAEENIKISYMDIVYSALVRLMAQRPRHNRFVMNGRTYARNEIFISLAIKKNLTDDGIETTIKLPFTGKENIFEIKEKLGSVINENKNVEKNNDTDALARTLSIIPNFVLKFAVSTIMFLDKHGILPKAIIKASPFHTSAFLTNVASLGIDAIYHHLYDFGTTGIFLAMGKKKKRKRIRKRKKRKKAAANDFDRYHRQFLRDRRGQHRRTSARQVYPRALQRRNGKGRGALRALHRRGRHARGRKHARRHPFDRDRRDLRRTITAR